MATRRQGIFWMLTIPAASYTMPTELPDGLTWIRGQQEEGEAGGYLHWQICVALVRKSSLSGLLVRFPGSHAELTKSAAANDYVWKELTRVPDTQFEFGTKPICRNSKPDWESVWASAQKGDLLAIPPSIRVVSYRTLRAIAADHDTPIGILRTCHVYWGATGTGKSRRAWDEAGMGAYSKDPRSKFWCGYQGEQHVVIDEFRGGIDISHILRWLDRYPVRIEIKGSSRPLCAQTIWITSNLCPTLWFPEADVGTIEALMRRLTIVEFPAINNG